MNQFWFVYLSNGGVPRYQHPSFESAHNEAKRLVETNGGTAYVMLVEAVVKTQAVSEFTQPDLSQFTVTPVPPSTDDDIPF